MLGMSLQLNSGALMLPPLNDDLHDHCGVLADITYTYAFVLTILIIIRVGLDIWPFSISDRILDIETIRISG